VAHYDCRAPRIGVRELVVWFAINPKTVFEHSLSIREEFYRVRVNENGKTQIVTRVRRARHLPWAPEAGERKNIEKLTYF
jgi:hypothetical protein